MATEVTSCTFCGSRDKTFSACSRCFSAQYCNRACQAGHWKAGHKQSCVTSSNVPPDQLRSPSADTETLGLTTIAEVEAKAKKVGPARECGFCGFQDPPLYPCSRCKITFYCGTVCQTAHWKEGHKQACLRPDQRRRPEPTARLSVDANSDDQCAICLFIVTDVSACTLPCNHKFHRKCVSGLRKFGVAQVCPICRANISAGPVAAVVNPEYCYIF